MRIFQESERKYFAVVRPAEPILFNGVATAHFSQERRERHQLIVERLGVPKNAYAFVVDKHHPNGYEVHTIFDNGVIAITNLRSGKLITELIARPAQISRYFVGKVPPAVEPIMAIAARNQRLGYNLL